VWRDPGNPWNWVALVVDVGTTLLPGVPAFAGAVQKEGKALWRAGGALDLVRSVAWETRFAGAGPEILEGVRRLERLVRNERIPAAFRQGWAAELVRAEEYFKAGQLQAVEAIIEGHHVDLVLVTQEIVEIKYWRQSYAEENIRKLLKQIQDYQSAGRSVILEFVQTQTDPITEKFIKKLLQAAQERNIPFTREHIRIITLGGH
jgi:hypothetical protein